VSDWIHALRRVLASDDEAVVVTVAATRGSVPREAGTRMIVGTRALEGTIGGGHLEFEAIRIARDALAAPRERGGNWLVRFPLAARLGQCCGGVASLLFQRVAQGAAWPRDAAQLLARDVAFALVTPVDGDTADCQLLVADAPHAVGVLPADVVATAQSVIAQSGARLAMSMRDGRAHLIERLAPNDFRIVLFGNGHVGRALAQVLATLSCRVTWVDQREHAFPATVADNVAVVATDEPVDEVRNARRNAMFVVMTHSHALDFALTAAILARGDFSYFGLIGSASKRAQFERRLAMHGVTGDALKRMACPIGTGAIRSKQPGAIAVAVAAEILALREASAAASGDCADTLGPNMNRAGGESRS
jgi:xanthine dehydrogenase accessory factor